MVLTVLLACAGRNGKRRPKIDDVLALPHIRQTLTDNLEAQRAVPVRRHRQRSISRQPIVGLVAPLASAPAPAPAPAPAAALRRKAWDGPEPSLAQAPRRQTGYGHRPRPFEYWSPPENGGAPRPRKSVLDRQKRADDFSARVRDEQAAKQAKRDLQRAEATAEAVRLEQLALDAAQRHKE
jgi:hypothetical protein